MYLIIGSIVCTNSIDSCIEGEGGKEKEEAKGGTHDRTRTDVLVTATNILRKSHLHDREFHAAVELPAVVCFVFSDGL